MAMKWVLASGTAALLIAGDAQAQEQGTVSRPSEDDIVVLGGGLPLPPGTPAYGSTYIERDRLENSPSGRIENILGDVAGFQQFRRSDSRSANPSAQGATLRALGGNASSRTLVLLDGVPMADPFFGYIPFSALVPERLSLIRVTRGGGSGAFGAGAVAGTIELASASRDELPVLSGSAFYGSRDATELAASISPDLGSGFVSVSGRWDRGDGFLTTPPAQRNAATVPAAYDAWSANLRAVAPVSPDAEIQARVTLFRDTRTLRLRGADSLSEGQDASIRFLSRGPWQVDALAYVQARNFSNIVISSSSFLKALDQRATPSTGLGGKIELRPPVGDAHVLRFGGDVRRASGTMFEDAYGASGVTARRKAGGEQTSFGVFLEDDWTVGGPGGSLVLTGGVRADHWSIKDGFFQSANASGSSVTRTEYADRDGWEATGRLGALFHASSALDLRVAGYTGFRLPTPNELYRPFVVFPIRTEANAALEPERLEGVEAGFDLRPLPRVSLGATLFYNRLKNAVANVTDPVVANLRQRQNVDAIVAKGVEITASAALGAFGLNASYAYSHSRVDAPGLAFDGFRPAQTPAHSASATLSWSQDDGPLLATTIRYVSRQYEDDLQTDALDGAVTVDAVASVPLTPGLRVVGRVENLFDKDVVTRNAGGSIDLGTPQTFWIGLRFAR